MNLCLDGIELSHNYTGDTSLLQVVEGEVAKIGEQRLAIGYEINGSPYEGEDQELSKLFVSDTNEFNIITTSIKDIILESLNGINEYLPQLIGGMEETALLIQSDKVPEAMVLMEQCITGLGWLIEIMDKSCQLIISNISPTAISDLPLLEKRQAVNGILSQVVEELNKGDMIMVGDLLEYELAPSLKEWNVVVSQLINRVESGLN